MYIKVSKNNKYKLIIQIIVLLLFFLFVLFKIIQVYKVDDNLRMNINFMLIKYNLPIADEGETDLDFKTVIFKAFNINEFDYSYVVNRENSFFDFSFYNHSADIKNSKPFVIDDKSIKVVETDLKKELDLSNAEVLIYHTHTSEAFSEKSPDSTDENYNIVGVGEELKNQLEENYGISVIHDKTNHCTNYVGCYQRSRETCLKYIEKEKGLKLIIDLHRDSSSNKNTITTTINGENYARVMFVNARNSSRYQKNQEVTKYFNDKMNELFPTVSRGIYTYKKGKLSFNQDLSDNSILIECGSNINSISEAKNTAKLIARIIAEFLNK